MGIPDACSQHGLVQLCRIMPRHHNLTTYRQDLAGQNFCKCGTLRLCGHLNRHTGSRRNDDVKPLKQHVANVIAYRNIAQRDFALQMRDRLRRPFKQGFVDHVLGGKPLCHDLPAQGHVLCLVIVSQQLFPRVREVLVGGKCGDQRADGDLTPDGQIATNSIEKERRQLCDEVVEELHEELLLEDPESDLKKVT